MNQLRKGIAVGTDDYSKVIYDNCYFVDKTSLIKDVFAQNKSEVLLISRPRRFGKTLTMSMFGSSCIYVGKRANLATDIGLSFRKASSLKI